MRIVCLREGCPLLYACGEGSKKRQAILPGRKGAFTVPFNPNSNTQCFFVCEGVVLEQCGLSPVRR